MTTYEFEISHKSGTVDCFPVQADGIATAWTTAQRKTFNAGATITTAKVRNPAAFGDGYWHALPEARKLEKIARVMR